MHSMSRSGWGTHPGVLAQPGWLALGVVAGTAGQLQQQELWPLWWHGLPPMLVALAWWFHRVLPGPAPRPVAGRCQAPARSGLVLLTGAALAFGLAGWRSHDRLADRLDASLMGQEVIVTGSVATLPIRGAQGLRFVFEVEAAEHRGGPVQVPRRIQVGVWRPVKGGRPEAQPLEPDFHAGDRWQLPLRLRPVHGLSNPHGGDRELHAWSQGIGAQASLRPGARWLGTTDRHRLERWREGVSTRLQERLQPTGHGGVLAALAVGDQDAIAPDDWQLFRRTGVAHLMAISGLHITLFAWLAMAFIGRAWRASGRFWPALLLCWPATRVAAVGGWCAAAAYALAAGWGVPAQRTVLMLALALWLRSSARRWPWPVQWLVVLAVVLLLEPWAWLQAGFWLSFVAVGILMASARPTGKPGSGRLAAALGLLREQLIITLALTPLSLWLFGETSVVGLLANLVAIPWVSWVVTPLTLLGALFPPLWDLAAIALDPLHRLLLYLADSDLAVWSRAVWPWPWALAAMVGAVLAVMPWPWLLRCGGLLVLGWALAWSPGQPAQGHFRLLALDVGQGSAVLVQTRHHALLHDTGPAWGAAGDAGARVVVPTLKALGVVPDRIVVSHRDSDHAGGAGAVRAAWPQAAWVSSEPDLAAETCRSGQQWQVDGVRFEMLSPLADDYAADGRGRLSSNAMSCVLRVEAADGTSAVLTGDVDAPRETRMALAWPGLRAELLVAPHHGSRSSSSPLLLNVWRPSVVIVQAGFMNRFGHPAAEVLERYRVRQARVFDTPSCGAAEWRSDAPQRVVCERQRRARYWHTRVEPAAAPAGVSPVP
ncbi:DNA internalization-related competence protein ComEC/Rec2 [uncultured Hydrogenophaga sp.]|uniref:DNA internalization-related competence protein ComEC/Rec2 n=1 Tax=uncultured Hydrogenophaga sp. TaxID=199683 RepID=UPI0037496A8E